MSTALRLKRKWKRILCARLLYETMDHSDIQFSLRDKTPNEFGTFMPSETLLTARVNLKFLTIALTLLGLLVLSAGVPQPTNAQSRPFGAGIIVGSPTGLNFKYWQTRRKAIDVSAAWSFSRNDAFHLHGDFLRHRYDVLEADRTPLYFGLGARLIIADNYSRLGIRFPLGVTHLIQQEPFDIFFEIAPILNLAPDTDLDIDGGFGIRYYFRQNQ